MAVLTVQKLSRAGLNPSFVAAAAGGDEAPFVQDAFIVVKNGGAGSIDVTLNSQKACDQGFDHDEVVAVPAGGERWIGLFSDRFRNATSGNVEWTYSGVTTVTVGVFEP